MVGSVAIETLLIDFGEFWERIKAENGRKQRSQQGSTRRKIVVDGGAFGIVADPKIASVIKRTG